MPTQEQVDAMGAMRQYAKAMVDEVLPSMSHTDARKAARMNQEILDMLNAEPSNDVNFMASFMVIETIAAAWEKGFNKTLQRQG